MHLLLFNSLILDMADIGKTENLRTLLLNKKNYVNTTLSRHLDSHLKSSWSG